MPERPQRRLVGASAELLRLLVVELERCDVAEHPAVDRAVALERAETAVPDEALGVEDELMPASGEGRERLEREVDAGESADDDPGGIPIASATQPSMSAGDHGSASSSISMTRRSPS